MATIALLGLGAGGGDSGSAGSPPEWSKALDAYATVSAELVDGAASAPVEELRQHARRLIELSRTVIGAFAVEYPPCGPYLAASLGVLERLDTISPEAVEREYHLDQALPDAPTWCYHTKDLLVHPATVLVLARDGADDATRSRITAEIQEARAHMDAVRRLFELGGPR